MKSLLLLIALSTVLSSETQDIDRRMKWDKNGAKASSKQTKRSSVTIVLIPDTQFYSEGAPYIYESQTKWLVENHNQIGYPFVLHLGDLVQSASVAAEWDSADKAMRRLEEANISYSVGAGNHDLINTGLDSERDDKEDYLLFFPSERARRQPTFRSRDPLGYSEYHLVSLQNLELLVLALDWRASNSTLQWAQQVLNDIPSIPTIVTSHEFLYPLDDEGHAKRTPYGENSWNSLIKSNDQIFLVICGHITASGHRVDENDLNHPVVQLIVDYQDYFAGGNGYMRLIEFDFFRGTMEHVTFSPFVIELFAEQGIDALAPHDLVELTDSANKYVLHFDFVKRFKEMNATIPADFIDEPGVSWLKSVHSVIDDVPLPQPDERPEPSGPDDYPIISETLAHWRFASENDEGTPLRPADVIYDLSGFGNNMTRRDVGNTNAFLLTWSSEHHNLSASPGSICFSNPDRDSGGFLTTSPGAPLASETFLNGFTIEAFVKLAPTWSSGAHRWAGIISRLGEGQSANRIKGDLNEPLAVLTFSPDREVQFASWSTNHPGIITAWSSPLYADQWYHLAAINDRQSTRLYVDGYPARRDPVHYESILGIATGNIGWSIGSSTYGERRKVFGGCIGEVRIVGRALEMEELLIARA